MSTRPSRRDFLASLTGALIAGSLPSRAGASQTRRSLPVRFGATLQPIPADFLGMGYETSAVATPGLLSARNTRYVAFVRTLGPSGLLRIGGNISDWTQWSPRGEAIGRAEPEATVLNQAVIDDFAAFLRATGWKAMWGLNLGSGSKEQAVAEAVAVERALGDRLHSFEIGNEVDLMGHRHAPGTWNYDAYHALYTDYKAAIRAALPHATFSGPDCAGNVDWCRRFAQTESADLRALTLHYYRGGAGAPTSTLDLLLQPDEGWARRLTAMNDLCRAQRDQGKNLTYRINETNSFSGGGKPGVSDVFGAALWCLDYLFVLAMHGCAGVNIETDVNQHHWVSHYSPIYHDLGKNDYAARPTYYGMLAFAQAARGNTCLVEVVAVADAPIPPTLRLYATRGGSPGSPSAWLVAINRDPTQSVTLAVTPPDFARRAHIHRLTAPSLDAREGITLAGTPVTSDGKWTLPDARDIFAYGGTVEVEVSGGSATLVEFLPAR